MKIENDLSVNKSFTYSIVYRDLLNSIFDSQEVVISETEHDLFQNSQIRNDELFLFYDSGKRGICSHFEIAKAKKFVIFSLSEEKLNKHIRENIRLLKDYFQEISKSFAKKFDLSSVDAQNVHFLRALFKLFKKETLTPIQINEARECLDRIRLEKRLETKDANGNTLFVDQDLLERLKISLVEIPEIEKAYLIVGPYQVGNICLTSKSVCDLNVNVLSEIGLCENVTNKKACETNGKINLLTKLLEFVDLNKLFRFDNIFSLVGKHQPYNPNKNSVSKNIFSKFTISPNEIELCKKQSRFIGVVKAIFNYYGIFLSYQKTLSISEIAKTVEPFFSEINITNLSYRSDDDDKEKIIVNHSDKSVENLFINEDNTFLGVIEDLGVISNCQPILLENQLQKHIENHSYRYNSRFNYLVSLSSSIYFSMSIEAYKLFKIELDYSVRKTFFLRRIPTIHRLSALYTNVVDIYGCDCLYVKSERARIFDALCASSVCSKMRKNIDKLSEGLWREINTLNSRVFPIVQILISLLTVFATIFVCKTVIDSNSTEEFSFVWQYLLVFGALCILFVAWNFVNRLAYSPNNYSMKVRKKIKNKKTT